MKMTISSYTTSARQEERDLFLPDTKLLKRINGGRLEVQITFFKGAEELLELAKENAPADAAWNEEGLSGVGCGKLTFRPETEAVLKKVENLFAVNYPTVIQTAYGGSGTLNFFPAPEEILEIKVESQKLFTRIEGDSLILRRRSEEEQHWFEGRSANVRVSRICGQEELLCKLLVIIDSSMLTLQMLR